MTDFVGDGPVEQVSGFDAVAEAAARRPWTPGLWSVDGDGWIVGDGETVAIPYRVANAALIALAPELAEAVLLWDVAVGDFPSRIRTSPAYDGMKAAAAKLRALIGEHGGEA